MNGSDWDGRLTGILKLFDEVPEVGNDERLLLLRQAAVPSDPGFDSVHQARGVLLHLLSDLLDSAVPLDRVTNAAPDLGGVPPRRPFSVALDGVANPLRHLLPSSIALDGVADPLRHLLAASVALDGVANPLRHLRPSTDAVPDVSRKALRSWPLRSGPLLRSWPLRSGPLGSWPLRSGPLRSGPPDCVPDSAPHMLASRWLRCRRRDEEEHNEESEERSEDVCARHRVVSSGRRGVALSDCVCRLGRYVLHAHRCKFPSKIPERALHSKCQAAGIE